MKYVTKTYDLAKRIQKICSILTYIFLALSLALLVIMSNEVGASIFVILAYSTVAIYVTSPWIFSNNMAKNILGITIIVLITSPFLVYSTVLLVRVLRPNVNSLPIVVGDSNTWISFAGSIIGGSMVMIALFFTIKSQNDNLKYSLIPNIDIFVLNSSNSEKILHPLNLEIKLLNTSPNPAKDIEVIFHNFETYMLSESSNEITITEHHDKIVNYLHQLFQNYTFNYLPSQKFTKHEISLYELFNDENLNGLSKNRFYLLFTVSVVFYDLHGSQKYIVRKNIELDISTLRKDEHLVKISSEENCEFELY